MRYYIIIFSFLLSSCAWKPYHIATNFDTKKTPPPPDYSRSEHWAALPSKKDSADRLPNGFVGTDKQATAAVDVFFLHPTIFTGEPKNEYQWNADVNDAAMNANVDGSTILNQASAFNGTGRVFAPRYRQAHYFSFVTANKEDKKQALDVAYEDVKAAFQYYMTHYNQGRPIIIAAHSQGTIHAGRLMKEFFDGKPLQNQLVEAYLIGITLQPTLFNNIKPSANAGDTGGFVSWNTFAKGFYPANYMNGLNTAVCTNPLSWKTDENYVNQFSNSGGVGLKFTFVKNPVDAECKTGLLWINKPYIKGAALLRTKVWHKADINFFWNNIRDNVALRAENFSKK